MSLLEFTADCVAFIVTGSACNTIKYNCPRCCSSNTEVEAGHGRCFSCGHLFNEHE